MSKMICQNWETCQNPCLHKDFHEKMMMCDKKSEPCANCAEADENAKHIESWVGFDLDGTLAEYHGWKGKDHIGAPIPKTMAIAKEYIRKGVKIKIFTARAEFADQIPPIKAWCLENGLGDIEVTNIKDRGMIDLFDDRCHRVETNTGKVWGWVYSE